METNINSKQRQQELLFVTETHTETQKEMWHDKIWRYIVYWKNWACCPSHTHMHTQRPPVLIHSGGLWCRSVSVYTELTIIASTPPLASLLSPSLPTRQADRHSKVETVIQNRYVWRSCTKDFTQSRISMGTGSEMIAGSMADVLTEYSSMSLRRRFR